MMVRLIMLLVAVVSLFMFARLLCIFEEEELR